MLLRIKKIIIENGANLIRNSNLNFGRYKESIKQCVIWQESPKSEILVISCSPSVVSLCISFKHGDTYDMKYYISIYLTELLSWWWLDYNVTKSYDLTLLIFYFKWNI